MVPEKIKDFFSNLVNKNEEYNEDEEFYDGDDDESYDDDVEEESVEPQGRMNFLWNKNSKVVSMPENQSFIKMKIVKPTSFDQAKDVCILLRNKNSVVLNLEYVQKEVGRRFLDYISGAIDYAEGKIEKVSNSVFVIAPYNYEIINDTKEQKFETKMAAPWKN